jgi:hypothetical protein
MWFSEAQETSWWGCHPPSPHDNILFTPGEALLLLQPDTFLEPEAISTTQQLGVPNTFKGYKMSHPHHHNNTKLYPWTYLGVYL